jgi:hypothetical protein
MATTTFNIFDSELRGVAASVLGENYGEWYNTQKLRINLWWNSNETIESASKMLFAFAEGERKRHFKNTFNKSAKLLAVKYTKI